MSVENSPSYNVESFNSSFFGTTTQGISQNVADIRYLRFPNSQGDQSFGNVSVSGNTNFSTNLPTCSTVPSTPSQLTNKTYVDVAAYENTVITSDAAYVQPQSTFMRNTIVYTGTSNAIIVLPIPTHSHFSNLRYFCNWPIYNQS